MALILNPFVRSSDTLWRFSSALAKKSSLGSLVQRCAVLTLLPARFANSLAVSPFLFASLSGGRVLMSVPFLVVHFGSLVLLSHSFVPVSVGR